MNINIAKNKAKCQKNPLLDRVGEYCMSAVLGGLRREEAGKERSIIKMSVFSSVRGPSHRPVPFLKSV